MSIKYPYKFLCKKDGRRWEIDHASKNYIYFKTLLSCKDYNGREQNKLDKRGLCCVSRLDVERWVRDYDGLYWFE